MRIIAVAVVVLSTGCATMFGGGRTQNVAINSAPEGAAIVVDGVAQWTTPHVLAVPRRSPPDSITFRLAGYEPVTVRLMNERTIDPWFWANIFTYGLGALVDWKTGAMWTHNIQDRVVVELETERR